MQEKTVLHKLHVFFVVNHRREGATAKKIQNGVVARTLLLLHVYHLCSGVSPS